MRMLEQEGEDDSNAEVTWEDQQRINDFSKVNNRVRILEGKLEELKTEKEALDDLSIDLELLDEDKMVLYRIGEAFLHMPQPRALKRLKRDQTSIDEKVATLARQAEECEVQMKNLKVVLYAKFGKAINLDE